MRRLFFASTSALALGMAGAANAADVVEVAPSPEPYVEQGYTWNGAYVGGFVGYNWLGIDDLSSLCDEITPPLQVVDNSAVEVGGNDFGLPTNLANLFPVYSCRSFSDLPRNNDVVGIFEDSVFEEDNNGWSAGAFVGVNRQYGKFVFGTELEGAWLDSADRARGFNFAYFDSALRDLRTIGGGIWTTEGPDWLAQGTIKAGWLFGSMDQALFYVKGGFAVSDKMSSSFFGGSTDDCEDCAGVLSQSLTGGGNSDSGYGFGGTIGGGIEYKLTQNFSIGGEYQFTHLNYSGGHQVTHTMIPDIPDPTPLEARFTNEFEDHQYHAIKLKATWHLN